MRRIRHLRLLFGIIPVLSLPAASPSWRVIETARDNEHRLTAVSRAEAASPKSQVLITCEPGQRLQEIVGFGGALTESSAWVLAQLAPAQRAEILRRYYDPNQGIGYTLARTHINSCDFSLHTWSLDETPGDYELHDFSLEPMRKWVLPLLHETQEIAGATRFKLMASPWSPPAWMKTNHRMDDGGALRPEYRPAWANFFVRFVKAMRDEEKIPVWALTVQNEPEAHQTWESCLYTPEEERDFVRDYLGPTLQDAGLADIKLLGWDHNRDRLEARASVLFADPAASSYLWGAALHWYISDDFAASSRVHDAFPQKRILFTEGCLAKSKGPTPWSGGEQYATNIMGDLGNWVCGWIDWNIVLDLRGGPNHVGNFCDAPVLVDTHTGAVMYQSSFYYIAHFSRFVNVGAHRIRSTTAEGLESIAFENPDGSLVVVAMNRADSPVEGAIAIDSERIGFRLPPHSIQTLISEARPH